MTSAARCGLAGSLGVLIVTFSLDIVAQTPRAPLAGRISRGLVQFLQMVPPTHTSHLHGITKYAGDSMAIFVVSSRASIAAKFRTAKEQGAKFTPSADDLLDVVIARCGDEDLGEILNCSKLTVTANGKTVVPITYRSGPRAFQNGFGATWSARLVTASFRAADVRDGFSLTATGPDGFTWTLEVSKADAQRELLLRLEDELLPGGL